MQHEDAAYYFIANLHALTTVRDAEQLHQLTLDATIDLLALGLNPDKAVLFVQSDIPEVSQLTWLLMTGTPMGLLERCHAYKDKISKGLSADAGLFTYPVLMAADILATIPIPFRSAPTRCSTSKSAAILPPASIITSAKRL